jgi:hypothetical protein
MRLRALILFLIVVTSRDIGFAQSAQPRYSLTISAMKTTVKAGSELRVKIVQENTTAKDQMFWIENVAGLHGEYLYLIDLLQLDGKKTPRSKYFREVRDEADNFMPGTASNGAFIWKKPGEVIVSSIDLNELYELRPGKYTVRVFQKDDVDKVTVTSNIITVTVTAGRPL